MIKISTGISSAVLACIAATVGLLLSGAAFVSTGALAQGTSRAAVTVAPNAAVLVGKTPTMSELASSQANLSALAAGRSPFEQPRHRLPNGALTSAPNPATLNALPKFNKPNVATQSANAGAPGSASFNGFVGIYGGDNAAVNGNDAIEPPDQGLAVNNNVAAEINNNVVQFFNATTGASLAGPIATSVFFQAPSGTGLTDTQAFFDPTTQRWFLTEVISNAPTFTGGPGTIEDFAVAVSTTSSATGQYYIYHIRAFSNDLSACGSNDCLPDYPKAGYDANIFIIDVNLFNASCETCPVVAAAGYALPKSLLESGSNFTYSRLTFPNDFVVQPGVPAPGEPFVTDANGTEYLMEARNIVDGSNNIRVWAISNTNNIVSNPSSLRGFAVDVAGESYGRAVPSTQPNVIGPYCTSKGVTSAPRLDGGYAAFQATVQKASGRLYGALAFGSNDGNGLNRDVIAWFALTPSVNSNGVPSASIFTQGYLVPTNGYSLSYPAFGLNQTSAGVLGFTETNQSASVPAGYPSASIIQFTGTTFTGNILVTGQGFTSDDGWGGCQQAGLGQVDRWGDYGAAVVDATTGYFYTANEMIPNPSTYPRGTFNNWGTFITQESTQQTTNYTLSLSTSGSGTVTSLPSGINCSSNTGSCSASFTSGTNVTLTAAPASGWTFSNWGGACSGTSMSCTVSMTQNTSVSATFTQTTPFYTLSVSTSGSGTVTSLPSGINCSSNTGTCSYSFTSGTNVTLSTSPTAGWAFSGWGGACSGTGGCSVSMTQNASVSATFTQTTTSIVSAMLPNARTATVGEPVTAFATILNAGGSTATSCSIALPSGVPANFLFQTTDPNTNRPTGTPNTPADIPVGLGQTFYFAVTPTQSFSLQIPLVFSCTNTSPAPVYVGVNTFQLTASNTPIPDMLSIADTLTHDGNMVINGTTATGLIVTAAIDIGAPGTVTFTPNDTPFGQPPRNLPLNLLICQTNSAGNCINPPSPGPSSTITLSQNQTVFLSLFATGEGIQIPYDPANARVFLLAAQGTTPVGETSAAVKMLGGTANIGIVRQVFK